MSGVTRTPAQAAVSRGSGRTPASPPSPSPSSQSGVATEREAPSRQGPRNTERRSRARSGSGTAKLCGRHRSTKQPGVECDNVKACRRPEHHCTRPLGWGTDHAGAGACKVHGGGTPNGKKAAAREKVEATLKALAIPVEGDPLEALQAAVERAHGAMIGAQALVAANGSQVEVDLYMRTIREAARTAKAAAEAINLDELVRIREREADLLEQALMGALERFGIGERRRGAFLAMFREELRARIPAGEELS